MAHWAQVENGVVVQVLVFDNDHPDGNEGGTWAAENLGGTWIQTSYNNRIRKNFASIGFTYDPIRDAFIPPKPFESWVLDEDTCLWESPIAYPTDGKIYDWDEDAVNWVEVIGE